MPEQSIELLIEFTKDEDARTRATAVAGLAKVGDPRGFAPVLVTLFDPSDEVRICAAVALGIFKDDRAYEALLECLTDPCEQVGVNCAWALGQLPTTRAFNSLISLLDDASYPAPVRIAAATAIGERAEIAGSDLAGSDDLIADAREALSTQLENDLDDMRASCIWALGHLPACEQTTRDCIALLQDPYPWTVRYAIEALVQFGPADAAKEIGRLACHPDEGVREVVQTALQALSDKGGSDE